MPASDWFIPLSFIGPQECIGFKVSITHPCNQSTIIQQDGDYLLSTSVLASLVYVCIYIYIYVCAIAPYYTTSTLIMCCRKKQTPCIICAFKFYSDFYPITSVFHILKRQQSSSSSRFSFICKWLGSEISRMQLLFKVGFFFSFRLHFV